MIGVFIMCLMCSAEQDDRFIVWRDDEEQDDEVTEHRKK